MELSNKKGNVFDIQGFSVHDGPGCRTLIFLNGCSLHCFWCSNPEGISLAPSLLHNDTKCIRCSSCVESCRFNAISLKNDHLFIDRRHCIDCQEYPCVKTCYSDAMKMSGSTYSMEELFSIIQRDREYWGSAGGVTLGGGEPLLQIDFAESFLRKCYDAYIHTAIETCGQVPWSNFERTLPYLEWFFFDLKHMNPESHRSATGSDNHQILSNARKLAEVFPGRIMFRMPLIPGFNDSESNIHDTAEFLKEINRREINILPLHHLGSQKYELLGREYPARDFSIPHPEILQQLKTRFEELGITCYIGNETLF